MTVLRDEINDLLVDREFARKHLKELQDRVELAEAKVLRIDKALASVRLLELKRMAKVAAEADHRVLVNRQLELDFGRPRDRSGKARCRDHLREWAAAVRRSGVATRLPDELVMRMDPGLDKYVVDVLSELGLTILSDGCWVRS